MSALSPVLLFGNVCVCFSDCCWTLQHQPLTTNCWWSQCQCWCLIPLMMPEPSPGLHSCSSGLRSLGLTFGLVYGCTVSADLRHVPHSLNAVHKLKQQRDHLHNTAADRFQIFICPGNFVLLFYLFLYIFNFSFFFLLNPSGGATADLPASDPIPFSCYCNHRQRHLPWSLRTFPDISAAGGAVTVPSHDCMLPTGAAE